MTPAEES